MEFNRCPEILSCGLSEPHCVVIYCCWIWTFLDIWRFNFSTFIWETDIKSTIQLPSKPSVRFPVFCRQVGCSDPVVSDDLLWRYLLHTRDGLPSSCLMSPSTSVLTALRLGDEYSLYGRLHLLALLAFIVLNLVKNSGRPLTSDSSRLDPRSLLSSAFGFYKVNRFCLPHHSS